MKVSFTEATQMIGKDCLRKMLFIHVKRCKTIIATRGISILQAAVALPVGWCFNANWFGRSLCIIEHLSSRMPQHEN